MNTKDFEGHTPGPWKVVHDLNVYDSTDRHVCSSGSTGTKASEWFERNKVNVRLIAAAPELLRQRNLLLRKMHSIARQTLSCDLHVKLNPRLLHESACKAIAECEKGTK